MIKWPWVLFGPLHQVCTFQEPVPASDLLIQVGETSGGWWLSLDPTGLTCSPHLAPRLGADRPPDLLPVNPTPSPAFDGDGHDHPSRGSVWVELLQEPYSLSTVLPMTLWQKNRGITSAVAQNIFVFQNKSAIF